MFGPSGTVLGSTSCPRARRHTSYHTQTDLWFLERVAPTTAAKPASGRQPPKSRRGGREEKASEAGALGQAEGKVLQKVLMPRGRFKLQLLLFKLFQI